MFSPSGPHIQTALQGTLPLHALPSPVPSNPPLPPTGPPAMLHFFVIELRVCPPSCSQCSHHRFSGTNSQGILSGFNKTVLKTLPRSRNLIVVESVLMAVAFVAMLLVRPRTGGWGGVNEVWGLRRGNKGAVWAVAGSCGLSGEPGLSPGESPL